MKIIPDTKYSNMYRLQWEDGDVSVSHNGEKENGVFGFYNLSRAKEFLRRTEIEEYERQVTYGSPLGRSEKPADAFL